MNMRQFFRHLQTADEAKDFLNSASSLLDPNLSNIDLIFFEPNTKEFYIKEYDFFINSKTKKVVHNSKIKLLSLKKLHEVSKVIYQALEVLQRESEKKGTFLSVDSIIEFNSVSKKEREWLHTYSYYRECPKFLS